MKHYVLAISGFSGVGKDESVKDLIKNYGCTKIGLADPAKRHMKDVYGFSDEQLFGPSAFRNAGDLRYSKFRSSEMPAVSGEAGDPKFWLSPREALQKYCGLMNELYEETWIRKGLEEHANLTKDAVLIEHGVCLEYRYYSNLGMIKEPGLIAINNEFSKKGFIFSCFTDVRHIHEIRLMNEMKYDFTPVFIRVKNPKIQKPPYDHRSETEQTLIPDSVFDFIINNDGTIDDLHGKMLNIVDNWIVNGPKDWFKKPNVLKERKELLQSLVKSKPKSELKETVSCIDSDEFPSKQYVSNLTRTGKSSNRHELVKFVKEKVIGAARIGENFVEIRYVNNFIEEVIESFIDELKNKYGYDVKFDIATNTLTISW